MIKTLVFEKNAVFFAENLQKSQKIVIITSTPGASRALNPRQNIIQSSSLFTVCIGILGDEKTPIKIVV
jgi:hypothetical protein